MTDGDEARHDIRRIGYARVSTADQNLDLQVRALKAAGCDPVYCDDGVSAVAPDRPEFAKALRKLKRGDSFVIWKMDRAFRSLIDALTVLQDLEARGITFQSLTDEIDTATAMGRFMYQIRNAFAELERSIISERTKAGMAAAKARGVAIGRPRKLSRAQVSRARRLIRMKKAKPADLAREYGVTPLTLARALKRLESAA